MEDATRRLADFLATPRATGVCLVEEGVVVGFALGHVERSGSADHFLLQELCVRPDRQRRGHGTGLLGGLAERMPGVEHWYLLTARESSAATFYERNGFRLAGRQSVYVRP